jgi:uncharacterized SAM-binding protein YcdF (DUF218 family)
MDQEDTRQRMRLDIEAWLRERNEQHLSESRKPADFGLSGEDVSGEASGAAVATGAPRATGVRGTGGDVWGNWRDDQSDRRRRRSPAFGHILYTCVKTVAVGLSACILLLAGTVIYFAYGVYGSDRLPSTQADAIVALSGDPERIREAVNLLAEGYGRRLLIAGIDNSAEIADLYPVHRALFDCCIDIDHRSGRTSGDAATIRRWALEVRPRSMIVVTSNFHIPRTLLEVRRALPDLHIVPFGVSTGLVDTSEPWRRPEAANLLIREYIKFVAVLTHARS